VRGDRDKDTICAIATPPGVGGVIVIRISGSSVVSGPYNLVKSLAPKLTDSPESHRIYFCILKDPIDGSLIDEVLVSFFQNGKSFTGEEVVEISCHGNPLIAQRIINALVVKGARVADRGEFTYRAFMHGKVDLIQAESILSLIESQSKKAAELSLNQLRGGISTEISFIESELIWLLAMMEASIDFSTEDIDVIDFKTTKSKLENLSVKIQKLISTDNTGRKIQSGFQVTLAGEPNVGKSSLLNCILKEDRAIVSQIPGTTRDLIHDQLVIDGVQVTITDSAGLRETTDVIESIGVSRTQSAILKSDLLLAVFDVTNPRFDELFQKIKDFKGKVIFVGNKTDLLSKTQDKNTSYPIEKIEIEKNDILWVSAFDTETRDKIIQLISKVLNPSSFGSEAIISQTRHYEGLVRSSECIKKAFDLIQVESSPEFITFELKDALISIQEILGKRFDDEILDKIFKEFCIGK
jgi:tRNA modification GTPase